MSQRNSDTQGKLIDKSDDIDKNRFPKRLITIFSTKFNGFTTVINVMLGTGPLIVPPVFLAAGVGLSSIFMFIVVVMSYVGAQYVCEGMSITNALRRIEQDGNTHKEASLRIFEGQTRNQKFQNNNVSLENDSHQNNTNVSQKANDGSSVQSFMSDLPEDIKDEMRSRTDIFNILEVCEYGQIAYYIIGQVGMWVTSIIIICYLYCGLISKMIITGQISSQMFGHIDIIDNYYFWMLLFFFSCSILSFRDMASIKLLQIVIATTRFLAIFFMILGAFIQMGQGPTYSLTPKGINSQGKPYDYRAFDFDEFNSLFSNVVFAFLMHHSIPGMVSSVRPEFQIKQVFFMGYTAGASVMYLVAYTAIIAFGPNLIGEKKLQYYNLDFQYHESFIYYFVSCYMLLNIAAIPVMCITLRNGMMKLFIPHRMPQSSIEVTKESFIFTLIILIPVLISAVAFQDNIQTVLHFTSSVFGMLLLLTIPSIFVILGRKQLRDSIGNYFNPTHSALINSDIFAYVMLIVSLFFFVYSTYNTISELV